MNKFHATYLCIPGGRQDRAREGDSQLEGRVLERGRETCFFIFQSPFQHQLLQEVLWSNLDVSLLFPQSTYWALPVLILSASAYFISFDHCNCLGQVATLLTFNRDWIWGRKLNKFPNTWFASRFVSIPNLRLQPPRKLALLWHTPLYSCDWWYAFASLPVPCELTEVRGCVYLFCTLGTWNKTGKQEVFDKGSQCECVSFFSPAYL